MVSIPNTDGTPLSVLEAMACGTPVVVGNLPDYDTDYIEPEITVLPARFDDPAAVAHAILRVLRESDTTRDRVTEARQRVERRGGYDMQMAQLENLYMGVVSPAAKMQGAKPAAYQC